MNIPVVKLGIIAVSRDCFPMTLSDSRCNAVVAAYQKKGGAVIRAKTVVENEKDAMKALDEMREAGVNALFVYLGNFGPEGPETMMAQKFDGPVMFAAAAEDSADAAAEAAGKYPRVNASGHWEIWNPLTGQWTDTGISAHGTDGEAAVFDSITAEAESVEPDAEAAATVDSSGPDTAKNLRVAFQIPRGAQGDRGETGDIYFAIFDIDPRTGELIMSYEDEYNGPAFSVDAEGRLKVSYRDA